MATKTVYVSKTQHYLKVKKPLLERQRRARINKCLDTLKVLVAEFQGDDAILRMDKAEMLESTIDFMRTPAAKNAMTSTSITVPIPMDCFRNGYMNAVGEISRVMAATPGMSVDLGKSVMTHLGCEFNRLLHNAFATVPVKASAVCKTAKPAFIDASAAAPMSPASSGYHSDCVESPMTSPMESVTLAAASVWRPW